MHKAITCVSSQVRKVETHDTGRSQERAQCVDDQVRPMKAVEHLDQCMCEWASHCYREIQKKKGFFDMIYPKSAQPQMNSMHHNFNYGILHVQAAHTPL